MLLTLSRSPSYYDAAASGNEADFGPFFAPTSEDYYFNSSIRPLAIARHRREIRNNPWLAGLFQKFPEAIGNSNLRSRTSDRAYNAAKDLFWFRYSKHFTAAGDTLRAAEDIIKAELLVAGEVFVIFLQDGRVQLIPSEHCGSGYTLPQVPVPGREANGIQYSNTGHPVAYRFGRMQPDGHISFAEKDTTLVDARHVIHIYHKDRISMGRGLPWLLASLRPARDLYEIARSKTKQIKDANSLSGFVETEAPENFLPGLSAATTAQAPEDENSPADKKRDGLLNIELRPGLFVALKPGEKLNALQTQYNATDYKELIMLMLHAISSPVRLPVELWFSGLGDVNYSGFKGLGTQWNGSRRHIIHFLEDNFLNRLQFWRISKAAKEGDLPENPDGDDDLIEWAWKQTAVLDEEKQAKANATRLQSGDICHADIWEERGEYPEEVLEKRRQLWIKIQIASGKLPPDADHSAVIVPIEFLLKNELPKKESGARSQEPEENPSASQLPPGAAAPSDSSHPDS